MKQAKKPISDLTDFDSNFAAIRWSLRHGPELTLDPRSDQKILEWIGLYIQLGH